MKKPSLIQVVCLIQLVVTALLAVIVSLRSPQARGPIINLVVVACAAITGLQAANSSIARKISIGLNMFEVLFLTPRQTHDFFNKFGKILSPRDRAGVRWPICIMNSIKSVEKVAWLSIS